LLDYIDERVVIGARFLVSLSSMVILGYGGKLNVLGCSWSRTSC